MPQSMHAIVAAIVKDAYTQNKALAISLIRGSVRSDVGPVLSALNMCTIPRPICGNKAIKMTMIPNPPIQWVNERHNNILCGSISKSGITVAPVPDRPEIHSNIPSNTPIYPPAV